MARPPWEVADVLRSYGEEYRQAQGLALPQSHVRVMNDIVTCRTAAQGGHVDACMDCGAREISYNSCRNRHCPKCQSAAAARWLEARSAEVLPVEYFHVVFTLPDEIAKLCLQNKRLIYNLLFKATAKTLCTIAADPKHLGAEIGFLAVLHTWGQTLTFHPHLHCIVPGGGFGGPGEWIACRPGYFLPVRVLSRYFRRIFLEGLRKCHQKGQLEFFGDLVHLRDPGRFDHWIKLPRSREWVVYAKKPFGGPRHVLDYLGRYTHRVAIANHRLTDVTNGQVSFKWRDYRHRNEPRTMTLEAGEFIRRFLLHVLPKGFVRIRHFGFLATRCRTRNIDRARRLLSPEISPPEISSPETPPAATQPSETSTAISRLCPKCQSGRLIRLDIPRPKRPRPRPENTDTS